MKEKKRRIDLLLVQKGLESSRERAKALIMSGIVFSGGQRIDKPGDEIPVDADIEIRGETLPYVSRGGLKLEKALRVFDLRLGGCVCMDIGASTGGFTDCMLQNGAKKVYAIDVGYGQLAWKIRNDPRVVNLERTNFRHIDAAQIGDPIDFFSVDVSFISLTLILPVADRFLKSGGQAVCLIKPQFEAGREKVGKKGVVRDARVHAEVIGKIFCFVTECGYTVAGLDFSPIKGPEGNIEYLLQIKKTCQSTDHAVKIEDIPYIVQRSHSELDGGASV